MNHKIIQVPYIDQSVKYPTGCESVSTVMSSAGAQSNHINHVSTQMQYAMPVAIVCIVGYLIAGIVQNWIIALGASLVMLVIVLEIIRKQSVKAAGK